jgi:hypothetical protein
MTTTQIILFSIITLFSVFAVTNDIIDSYEDYKRMSGNQKIETKNELIKSMKIFSMLLALAALSATLMIASVERNISELDTERGNSFDSLAEHVLSGEIRKFQAVSQHCIHQQSVQ